MRPWWPRSAKVSTKPAMSRGRTVAIEFRWADGQYDRLTALVADLVRRQVLVIAATSTPAAQRAKAATSTIPIVRRRPDRTRTCRQPQPAGRQCHGSEFLVNELTAKQFEVLHKMVPEAALLGFLINPDFAYAGSQTKDAQDAARALGCQLLVLTARTESETRTSGCRFDTSA